jgi:acyl-CoA thioesterase II
MRNRDGAMDLVDALALEQIESGVFRANFVRAEEYPLYGGQVAAQALAAAGATVSSGRVPSSLHGYFLRRGEADLPTVFRVECDRDGRSFSARRVIAIQRGEVIFNMAALFYAEAPGPQAQQTAAPDMPAPHELVESVMGRYPAIEVRAEPKRGKERLPTRFWARVRHALPDDPLSHACALTYISDMSSGLASLLDAVIPAASLDHAVWFHRPTRPMNGCS